MFSVSNMYFSTDKCRIHTRFCAGLLLQVFFFPVSIFFQFIFSFVFKKVMSLWKCKGGTEFSFILNCTVSGEGHWNISWHRVRLWDAILSVADFITVCQVELEMRHDSNAGSWLIRKYIWFVCIQCCLSSLLPPQELITQIL